MWCIPTVGAAFVAGMEEILELYEMDYDPAHPQVCLDEKSKQLPGSQCRCDQGK
jgi:hypothetical protein